MRQCMPEGLTPGPFKMPDGQPSRLHIRSARRAARSPSSDKAKVELPGAEVFYRLR